MSKLLDMFTQVRRAQGGSGIGFVGKSKAATKPRVAALVVELSEIDKESAEAAIKAGADGLLFTWDGKGESEIEKLKQVIDAATTSDEKIVCGLQITGGWDKLERESIERFRDAGVIYIVLPLQAPARLLALKVKDLDLVVTVPMREGEMYPIFIRNLTAFDNITAVRLDFWLTDEIGTTSIEDALHYRAVREAVRFPALLNVRGNLNEADAYTLVTLGVQAVVLSASDMGTKTQKQIKALRELLEKVHAEEKEKEKNTPTLLGRTSAPAPGPLS
jgi:2-methylisocitrate lyase-like PEP mutase family enzyme